MNKTTLETDDLMKNIVASTNISKTSTFCILHNNLVLRHVFSGWIPYDLSEEQMQTGNLTMKQMLQKDPNFLRNVITSDEIWLHNFDSFAKFAISVWNCADSPSPKKTWQSKSAGKVMIITFFDHKGVIY